jgi:hypothetical protein
MDRPSYANVLRSTDWYDFDGEKKLTLVYSWRYLDS